MALFNKFGNVLKQAGSGSNASLYQAIRCLSKVKLFIGGLSYDTDEQGLSQAFNPYGQVTEARIIKDHTSGNSRGFGFVSFDSDEAATSALVMDGQDLDGRRLSVKYALDKPRGGNYSGGGNYNGYGGGGNYKGGGNYGNEVSNNYSGGGGNVDDGGEAPGYDDGFANFRG